MISAADSQREEPAVWFLCEAMACTGDSALASSHSLKTCMFRLIGDSKLAECVDVKACGSVLLYVNVATFINNL